MQAYRCAIGERLVVRGRIDELLRYTQTLTLWSGVDRVECRTTIDEFNGSDRLLRLRWPTPVPGAMPVSEVGDAVVGRGFALIHEPGSTQSVDTAVHPWTLENPAYGWFGLSSAVRIVFGSNKIHAISVAEVVTPAEAESEPLARDLMVALVRAGVTATCSGADKPRYGHLEVDSNLPDTRISLGGPERNAFTAAVLSAADPAYTAELRKQLEKYGSARVFVPASASLATEWVPDADLRGARALPVLLVAGNSDDTLRDAIAAVTGDLEDTEIAVSQQAPIGHAAFEGRTVALLNRGVPSFAVEADGTLHTSLMRSCSGWPSGVWTTHERRSVPDGSNFQLQHWTHAFDYAVVADDGDWRQARIPARGAEFARPLLATIGGDGDTMPAPGSLIRIAGDGVHLDALKLAGNPTPEGSAAPHGHEAVLRLIETQGRAADVVIGSGVGSVERTARAGLLEDNAHEVATISLHGFEIATVLAELNVIRQGSESGGHLAPDAEAAQPLYARYWLHNRGPAPLGGLPAVAHLHPHHVTTTESELLLRLTAASDCTDATLSGTVELVCPAGWSAVPAALPFALEPGAHLEADVAVTMPAGTAPGRYPVRAQLTVAGFGVPTAWHQTVEDVCLITVGDSSAEVLRLEEAPADVVLAAGEDGQLSVTVGTDVGADLAVEAHLISPWGTWDWIGPAAVGAVLPGSGWVRLDFAVTPPPWTEPGEWWALVRVAAAGHLLYTPAVRVVVR